MRGSLLILIILLLSTMFSGLSCGKKAPPRLPMSETSVNVAEQWDKTGYASFSIQE